MEKQFIEWERKIHFFQWRDVWRYELKIIIILINIIYLYRIDCSRKKEGKGVYKYYNNNVYNGEWKGDKKEGHGNYKYEDKGEEYTGEF